MSSESPNNADNSSDSREVYAEAFNRETDPLKQYSDTFFELPDPYEYFISHVLENNKNVNSDKSFREYRRTWRQWSNYMEPTDRHPACPSPEHVSGFIEWRRDIHQNSRRTIQGKLNRLNRAYEHWQAESIFPHHTDYNPIELARDRTDLGTNNKKPFPNPSLEKLQSEFSAIENIRNRTLIGMQLKQGCRRGEVSNMQIQDVHIDHSELLDTYSELGTSPALDGVSNAIHIPTDRPGNKSSNPRLLPIDEELRWLIIQHLTTRPKIGKPWVFLSETSFSQIDPDSINRIWKKELRPQFGPTDKNKGITSHFGRHWFSSHWRLNVGLDRERVQYMRGDRIAPMDDFPDAIDDYLHPNFDHIESVYRNQIFKLNLPMRHFVSKQ